MQTKKSSRQIVFMCMTSGQDINTYCNNLSKSKALYNKLATGGNDPTISRRSRFTSLANNGTYKTITKTNQYDYNVPNPPHDLNASGNVSSKSISVSFTAPNKLITYTIQLYDNSGNLMKQINTNRTSYLFNDKILFDSPRNVAYLITNEYSALVTANINNGIYLGNTYQVDSANITKTNNSDNSFRVTYDFTPPIEEQQVISYYTLTLFDSGGKIVQKINTTQTNCIFYGVSTGTYYIYVTATNNNGTSAKNSSLQIVF